MRVLHIRTRHLKRCTDRHKGPYWPKCLCPKQIAGTLPDAPKVYNEKTGRMERARIRKSSNSADWDIAEQEALGMERGVGIFQSKKLNDAIAEWKGVWEIGESTRRKYARLMDRLAVWSAENGVVLVEELTLEKLKAFYESRKKVATTGTGITIKLGPRTKAKEIETLRAFYRFCIECKYCLINPALKIKPPKGMKPNEIIPFNSEQVTNMLAACHRIGGDNPVERRYVQLRAYAMFLLLHQVALRLGDAYGLRRDSIKNGVLEIHTQKSGRPIRRQLSRELLQALDAVPPVHQDVSAGQYYFWTGYVSDESKDGGHHRMVVHANRMVQPVFRAAGINKGHAHTFRHTLAKAMLDNNSSMAMVALALGHTVAVCEKHYAKYDLSSHKRVDELIAKAQNRGTYSTHEEIDALNVNNDGLFIGGEGGIRTHDTGHATKKPN